MNKPKQVFSKPNNVAQDAQFVASNVASSAVKIITSPIPIVGSVVSELFNIVDNCFLQNRQNEIQEEINKLNYTVEQIQDRIKDFDEHRYYFTRNNLKYYFLNCIPEASRELCQRIIKYIMGEEEEFQEQVCEIIQQLNAHDIKLINIFNDYLINGLREEYNIKKSKHDYDLDNPSGNNNLFSDFKDNNCIFDERTIFYEDFIKFLGFPGLEPENLLNSIHTRNGKQTFNLTYIMQSLLKMQSLGLISIDFKLTLGNSSTNNLDRFHVSVFGKEFFDLFSKE